VSRELNGRPVVKRPRDPGETGRRPPALPYSVAVNAAELRHQMRLRGLTGAEVARRAKTRGHKVAEATISHALNGWRIHPAKLRAIAAVLQEVDPLPGVESLVRAEPASPHATPGLGR